MRIRQKPKKTYKRKLSQAYKINMIAFGVGVLVFLCLLTFWVRIFEKWDKATVVAVEDGDGLLQIITFKVDGEEFVCSYPSPSNGQGKSFSPGDRIEYLVSNPNIVFPRRLAVAIPMIIVCLGNTALLIWLSVKEFKEKRPKNQWYYYDDIK